MTVDEAIEIAVRLDTAEMALADALRIARKATETDAVAVIENAIDDIEALHRLCRAVAGF